MRPIADIPRAGGLARLRGLAFRARGDPLLIPRCRSVHTFGMRFPLDLFWLDAGGAVVRTDRAVPPRRIRVCARARAVVEAPAGALDIEASAGALDVEAPAGALDRTFWG